MLRRCLTALVIVVAGWSSGSAIAAPCWRPPVEAPISDPFRAPRCTWCPGNRGIEYATTPGTTVRVAATGVVTFSGVVAGTRYVVIEVVGGWRHTYGYVTEPTVRRGDRVVAGVSVGTATDRFHFGVRLGDRYVDPAPMLGTWTYRPRLIPTDGSPGPGGGAPRLRCG